MCYTFQKDTIAVNQTIIPPLNGLYTEEVCPMVEAMNVIGGRWKLILIARIHQQSPARFGELKRSLVGITQKMLTTQLRELEQDGIIDRKVYAEVPPKVEYTLTAYGLTLEPVVSLLYAWGAEHRRKQTASVLITTFDNSGDIR